MTDRDRRYQHSKKGRAARAKYEHSEKGRARKRRWARGQRGVKRINAGQGEVRT